jgi:phage shock protein C
MFCPQCGREYQQRVNFCCHCGAAMFQPVMARKKLARSRSDRKLGGVCAGFAEHLDIDVTLMRLIWIMLALFGGWGLIAYIIAWIIMPEEPLSPPASVPSAAAQPQPAPNH